MENSVTVLKLGFSVIYLDIFCSHLLPFYWVLAIIKTDKNLK